MKQIIVFLALMTFTTVARGQANLDVAQVLLAAAEDYAASLKTSLAFTDLDQPGCLNAIDPRSSRSHAPRKFNFAQDTPANNADGKTCSPWYESVKYGEAQIGKAEIESEPASNPLLVNVTTVADATLYPEDLIRSTTQVQVLETVTFTRDVKISVDLSQGELNTLLHRDAQIEVDASTTEAQNFTDLLANVHDCTNTTLDASQCYTVKTTKSTSSSVATVPFSVPVSGNVYLRFKDRVALDVDRGQTPLITDIFFPGEEYNDAYWSVPVKILLQRAKDMGIGDAFTISEEGSTDAGASYSGKLVFFNSDAHYHATFEQSCLVPGSTDSAAEAQPDVPPVEASTQCMICILYAPQA